MSTISRGNKGEERVIKALKKRKDYFKLLNNVTFRNDNSEMTHQVDHIFINSHGVFVIETKNYYGTITVIEDENLWFKEVKGDKEIISNPLKQNKSHRKIVKNILGKNFDVISVVVFVKNNAPYLGDENVINFKDLNAFIDCYPYSKELNEEEIKEAYKLIKASSVKISKAEHLENISYLSQIKRELKAEIEYAVENNICPRCGGKMVEENYHYRCSKCDFKFNL